MYTNEHRNIYSHSGHLYLAPVSTFYSFEAVYCFICGRRMVAVSRYRMISLVLVNSHLFPLPCGAGSTVPREGFNLSGIILASLLVWPMLGYRHSLLWNSNNFTFFSSRMHIFKHSYLYTPGSRGHNLVFLTINFRYRDVLQGHLLFVGHFNELYHWIFPLMCPL